MKERPTLEEITTALEAHHGAPDSGPTRDPFQLVLYENAAYLVDDIRRAAVFAQLRARIGTSPRDVLRATPEALIEAIRDGGMFPERRAEKLVRAAEIAVELDLAKVLRQPVHVARKVLQSFPGFGVPGADKLLLIAGSVPLLALDSNGLRVLLRIGYGREARSYAATYRSVQNALGDVAALGAPALERAHRLLRRHGQTLCTRSRPLCAACPLRTRCAHGMSTGRLRSRLSRSP